MITRETHGSDLFPTIYHSIADEAERRAEETKELGARAGWLRTAEIYREMAKVFEKSKL